MNKQVVCSNLGQKRTRQRDLQMQDPSAATRDEVNMHFIYKERCPQYVAPKPVFLWNSKDSISLGSVFITSHPNRKKSYDKPRQHIKKQRHHFDDKDPYSQMFGFSSNHVPVWELDHKEGWVLKNWYFWTTVLEKTLESCLNKKEIKTVTPKGNQPWIFIGRPDTEAPILWLPEVKNQLIWKGPDAGKVWRQEKKGMTEDQMVG